jgi:hypothetical protein
MSELAHLMEEPPGGPNHGHRASTNPEVEGSHVPLGADEWQAAEFMRGGGWSIVTAQERGWAAGMHAHRGAVHPDEYVDDAAVLAGVESALGFTVEEVQSVYARNAKGGPLPGHLRELRGRLDARLLALSRSGGNLLLLARLLGLHVKAGDAQGGASCDAIERALVRARDKETP